MNSAEKRAREKKKMESNTNSVVAFENSRFWENSLFGNFVYILLGFFPHCFLYSFACIQECVFFHTQLDLGQVNNNTNKARWIVARKCAKCGFNAKRNNRAKLRWNHTADRQIQILVPLQLREAPRQNPVILRSNCSGGGSFYLQDAQCSSSSDNNSTNNIKYSTKRIKQSRCRNAANGKQLHDKWCTSLKGERQRLRNERECDRKKCTENLQIACILTFPSYLCCSFNSTSAFRISFTRR